MAKKKLTKGDLEAAKGPDQGDGWSWIGCGEVPGFGARLYRNGRKVFSLRYRTSHGKGKTRLLSIGTFGELTVDEARAIARREKVRVLEGVDPMAERQREAVEIGNVRDLMARWLEDYAKRHRKRWPEDRDRIARAILPGLGKLRPEDVTTTALRGWHGKRSQSAPVEANRALETFRAAWRWAKDQELLPEALPVDPTRKVTRNREQSRDRWLKKPEVARLMEAVRAEEDPYVRAAVPLLLLTGLRKRELLHARWSDVDFDRGELRLPTTKSGSAQTRLLPAPAVSLLRDLPRFMGSPWVFPSPADTSRPRDDLKKPWNRIRKAAGLEDVTLHDLRRTAGSYMAQNGIPLKVIGEVLGQSSPAATAIYARLASENERQALDTLSDALAGVLGLSPAPAAPEALPDRLRALLDATKDDPEALSEGLRGLGLGRALEA